MQEKRGELFNRRRLISEFESTNMEDTLKEMVRQELRNLTMSDVFERIEERDNKPTVKLETDLLTERGSINIRKIIFHIVLFALI